MKGFLFTISLMWAVIVGFKLGLDSAARDCGDHEAFTWNKNNYTCYLTTNEGD